MATAASLLTADAISAHDWAKRTCDFFESLTVASLKSSAELRADVVSGRRSTRRRSGRGAVDGRDHDPP